MNLLKALFNPEVEETTFFENTYPLINSFFDQPVSLTNPTAMVALVKSEIQPGKLGNVRLQGVRWRAYSDRADAIPIGTQVRIIGRYANILIVEPL